MSVAMNTELTPDEVAVLADELGITSWPAIVTEAPWSTVGRPNDDSVTDLRERGVLAVDGMIADDVVVALRALSTGSFAVDVRASAADGRQVRIAVVEPLAAFGSMRGSCRVAGLVELTPSGWRIGCRPAPGGAAAASIATHAIEDVLPPIVPMPWPARAYLTLDIGAADEWSDLGDDEIPGYTSGTAGPGDLAGVTAIRTALRRSVWHTEVVARCRTRDGREVASTTAASVYDGPAGRVVGVPAIGADGRRHVTLAPGGRTRLVRAITAVLDELPRGWGT